MVTKYKDEDIKLQSTTKYIKANAIICGIIIIILIFISWFLKNTVLLAYSPLIILLAVIYFQLQYSLLETKDKVLFIQRGFFKKQIPYKDLINIYKSSTWDSENHNMTLYIIIEYKKENRIKHLRIPYKEKRPFLKLEFIKEDEINKFINTFDYNAVGRVINDIESSNSVSTGYKNIREEEEEAKLEEILNKKNKNEQVIMWLIMGILIVGTLGFIIWFALL